MFARLDNVTRYNLNQSRDQSSSLRNKHCSYESIRKCSKDGNIFVPFKETKSIFSFRSKRIYIDRPSKERNNQNGREPIFYIYISASLNTIQRRRGNAGIARTFFFHRLKSFHGRPRPLSGFRVRSHAN